MYMAKELPYLSSYKNVDELFQKILSAKQPDIFTTRFLAETLGLKSSGDRQFIALLKALGLIDSGAKPTAEYSALKNPAQAKKAVARGIRRAYEPLFAANENAQDLQGAELSGLIAQVAGTDSGVTSKIAGTFRALVKNADFAAAQDVGANEPPEEPDTNTSPTADKIIPNFAALHPEFHYNIQIHLPANASEETYLNIFNSLRKAFKP
jgi:hypothetical protein